MLSVTAARSGVTASVCVRSLSRAVRSRVASSRRSAGDASHTSEAARSPAAVGRGAPSPGSRKPRHVLVPGPASRSSSLRSEAHRGGASRGNARGGERDREAALLGTHEGAAHFDAPDERRPASGSLHTVSPESRSWSSRRRRFRLRLCDGAGPPRRARRGRRSSVADRPASPRWASGEASAAALATGGRCGGALCACGATATGRRSGCGVRAGGGTTSSERLKVASERSPRTRPGSFVAVEPGFPRCATFTGGESKWNATWVASRASGLKETPLLFAAGAGAGTRSRTSGEAGRRGRAPGGSFSRSPVADAWSGGDRMAGSNRGFVTAVRLRSAPRVFSSGVSNEKSSESRRPASRLSALSARRPEEGPTSGTRGAVAPGKQRPVCDSPRVGGRTGRRKRQSLACDSARVGPGVCGRT